MIKQINITNLENIDIQLTKALDEGYTHFAPYSNDMMIHQKMLEAVELKVLQSLLIIQSTNHI